jgi:hypothetical protein
MIDGISGTEHYIWKNLNQRTLNGVSLHLYIYRGGGGSGSSNGKNKYCFQQQ